MKKLLNVIYQTTTFMPRIQRLFNESRNTEGSFEARLCNDPAEYRIIPKKSGFTEKVQWRCFWVKWRYRLCYSCISLLKSF